MSRFWCHKWTVVHGQRHETINCGGQEVKDQGHTRPGGSIIVDPLRSSSFSSIIFLFVFFATRTRRIAHQICIGYQWGLEMRRSGQGCALTFCFLGVWSSDVHLNLWGQPPPPKKKLKYWGVSGNGLSLSKTKIHINWKLLSRSWRNFYRRNPPYMCLRGWSHGCLNKSKMADGSHIEFRKCYLRP